MNESKRIAVIGAGAVGGFYGGLLQRAGQDVHFLFNRDFEHVRSRGLRIDSVMRDFVLPEVQAYNDPAQMPVCDVVLVALKTTANAALKTILPEVLKPDGVVLVLQNGLGPDEEVAQIVGPDRVLGGLCFLCSNKIGAGHIHHLDYGLITLGEYRADGLAGGVTPRLKEVGHLLKDAGIPIRLEEDLLLARWKKLVWNIPFNGLSVVKNCLTDVLVNDVETRELCGELMSEVAMASAACARPIEPSFLDQMMTNTEKMKPYAPSMKLDFDAGRPLELNRIYETPLRIAKSKGVRMPRVNELYHQLLTLDPVN